MVVPLDTHIPRRRWGIALLLGVGVLVNYIDRVNVSVAQSYLQETFGITTVTFGFLLSAYSWTYALLQLPSGVLLDRFGVKLVGRVSTFIWGIASFAAAVAPGVTSFFGARLLLGVGEAATFPGNAKATGYWFPVKERGLATAIFDASAKFAPAIGAPLIGYLMFKTGWRVSFAATGVLSLCYFALFYCFYRNPSEDKHLSELRTGVHSRRRSAAGTGDAHPQRRAASLSGPAEEGHWRFDRFRLLQLHFLSAADLAAELPVLVDASRSVAFVALYGSALALRHRRRAAGRRLARRRAGKGRP